MCIQLCFPFLVIFLFTLLKEAKIFKLRQITSLGNHVKTFLCSSRNNNYYNVKSSSWKKRMMVRKSGRFLRWFLWFVVQSCINKFLKLGWGGDIYFVICPVYFVQIFICQQDVKQQDASFFFFSPLVYLCSVKCTQIDEDCLAIRSQLLSSIFQKCMQILNLS